MSDLALLETAIGITIKDKSLLQNAFIHRSYLNEHRDFPMPSNEKLEFLGDSVLSLITSVYLYKHYPDFKEGDYTEIKASIVKTSSLAAAAKELSLGDYLFLSRGEELGRGRANQNLLADCFEALIAVIFIDQGFDRAYEFVSTHLFKDVLDQIITDQKYHAAKSKLQELMQSKFKQPPIYKIHNEEGPEHDRTFTVGVYLKDKQLAEGRGRSKKEAEEQAAAHALQNMV